MDLATLHRMVRVMCALSYRLLGIATLAFLGCGRRNYDPGAELVDAGGMTLDALPSLDAPLDGRDGAPDAALPSPIDIVPNPLIASEWVLRPYVSVGATGCVLTVDYLPDGGNPGDRIRVRLSGCPPTGGDFVQYLEYQPFGFADLADGRTFCSIAVTLDARLDSVADATGDLELYIGVMGTHVDGAPRITGTLATVVSSTTPGAFGAHSDAVNLDGAIGAMVSRADPVRLVLAIRRRDWTTSADFEASFDNPTFHVEFAREGHPECDGIL